MFRGILTTLGVGAVVTGSSSSVLANPSVISKPESDFNTLSAESLRDIENRSLSKDYRTLISENLAFPETSPIVLSDKSSAPVIKVPKAISELIKRVDFSTGGSSLDSEQLLRVRLNIDLR